MGITVNLISFEGNIGKDYSNIFFRNLAIAIEVIPIIIDECLFIKAPITLVSSIVCLKYYLHVECQPHPGVQVTDKHLNHIFDKSLLGYQPVAVLVEHLKEAIIDNSRQIAVLDESDLVKFFLLYCIRWETPQGEIFVQVFEVGVEVVFHKLGIPSEDVEILHLDKALHLLRKHE